ncbi:paraquat-inducible protein A [Frigidibacter sp. MR17.14]|uniref:paraquat-inducible protein A n=1 Tax=Frigidibacter sp. MR17.14 TaxID=3126509 RepID=UPI003012E862
MSLHAAPHTARAAGLLGCRSCGRVFGPDEEACTRCGAALHSREPGSLQRVWAWWIAGLIVYFPANIYPMLITRTLGNQTESTILGGVVELAGHGDYGVAGIVFLASIVIPVSKFVAIAYLAGSIGRGPGRRGALDEHRQHRLHTIVEFIGRWSMIDVFVVAILASLVQFEAVATINPGIAAVSFALSVAFTMLSAQSFDPRLIWDED